MRAQESLGGRSMVARRKLCLCSFVLLLLIIISIFAISDIDNMKAFDGFEETTFIESAEIGVNIDKDSDQHISADKEATCEESGNRYKDKEISTMSWTAILILVGTSVAAMLEAFSIKRNLNNSE